MKYLLSLFFLVSSSFVFSQKEASNWYFGVKAGLKFNDNGTVSALMDGQNEIYESSACISDKNGNLLFYTDGNTIWNKNHQIMSNGDKLFGGLNQAQSSIILPKPNSTNLYYVFVVSNTGYSYGHSYSVIDMNGDNGLGNVTSEKNIKLYTPTSQKVTAVKHANNKDYWIVTQNANDGTFYCYLLTENGVNPIPIKNTIGQNHFYNSSIEQTFGGMKLSPDGKKLAVGRMNNMFLYDFDNTTGIISNEQLLYIVDGTFYNNSVEFSSDSKLLYCITYNLLYQFDIQKNPYGWYYNYVQPLYTNSKTLQLGIDKDIFVKYQNFEDFKVKIKDMYESLDKQQNGDFKLVKKAKEFYNYGGANYIKKTKGIFKKTSKHINLNKYN